MEKIHLISGFPRSGSTLLCQILNMNPDFYATQTSPLLDFLTSQQIAFSHNPASKAMDRELWYDNFAEGQKAFIKAFYKIAIDKEKNKFKKVIFDKNRNWLPFINKLDEIFYSDESEIKIIWTYRNPFDILKSIESKHQSTCLLQYSDEVNTPLNTLASRIQHWTNPNGIIGQQQMFLIDLIDSGYKDRILLVDYKDLCENTQDVLDRIHAFIGEEKYNYSKNEFKDLKQVTQENDGMYNYKFPHIIKEGSIAYKEANGFIPNKYKEQVTNGFKYVIDLIEEEKNKYNKPNRNQTRKKEREGLKKV